MKKLILALGLFVALALGASALDITMTQGNGIVYNHSDIAYGYPSWGQNGEVYPAYDPLIWGYIENAGGGFAVVTVTVDTDYPSDFYYVGDTPGGLDELYIELF